MYLMVVDATMIILKKTFALMNTFNFENNVILNVAIKN